MFVDASALVAILSGEREAERVSDALASAEMLVTSPIAILETVLALARPDKFNRSVDSVQPLVLDFVTQRGIRICDMPPAAETVRLALLAATRYRSGRYGLNLGDCLHYAFAKHYAVPVLATDDEFRRTDLAVVV